MSIGQLVRDSLQQTSAETQICHHITDKKRNRSPNTDYNVQVLYIYLCFYSPILTE